MIAIYSVERAYSKECDYWLRILLPNNFFKKDQLNSIPFERVTNGAEIER